MNILHNPVNRQIDIQNAKVLRRPLQLRRNRRSKNRLVIVNIHINRILSCKVIALPPTMPPVLTLSIGLALQLSLQMEYLGRRVRLETTYSTLVQVNNWRILTPVHAGPKSRSNHQYGASNTQAIVSLTVK